MKPGVKNSLHGEVESIKQDELMAQVTMWLGGWGPDRPRLTSVMTRDSLEEANFKQGDTIDALVEAINVVMVKH